MLDHLICQWACIVYAVNFVGAEPVKQKMKVNIFVLNVIQRSVHLKQLKTVVKTKFTLMFKKHFHCACSVHSLLH